MYLSINSPPPCVFPLNLLLASKGVASSIVHITGTSLCCVMPADLFLASFFFFFERQTGTYHPIHGAERNREYGESWGGAFQLI